MQLADIVYRAGAVPQGVGSPHGAAAIILMGLEAGLKPVQALQSIMIVNGRTSMWGDALLALVRASKKLAKFKEWFTGEPFRDDFSAHCLVQREGEEEKDFTYSVADAKTAGLWEKRGKNGSPTPWITGPKRQLQMRARSFALRDTFTDVLFGLIAAEEAEDLPVTVVVKQPDSNPPVSHGSSPASLPPPASTQPPSPPAQVTTPTIVGELMVDDATVVQIAELRPDFMQRWAGFAPPGDKASFDDNWRKVLKRFNVDSARKLTMDQANELIRIMTPPTPETAEKLEEDMRKFF